MKTKIFLVMAILLVLGLIPLAGNAVTVSPPLIEIDAAKGDIINQVIKVRNEGTEATTYYLSAEKFVAAGEEGSPQFVSGEDIGLATWIQFPYKSISVPAGGTVEVPFSIIVPNYAGPGGYYAAVFLGSMPPEAKAAGTQIGIASRIGTLILVKIAGEIKENAELAEFSTTAKSYLSLPATLIARVKNTGNVHVKPMGEVVIKNMFGSVAGKVAVNESGGNVLPDSIRKFEANWVKNPDAKGATTFWGKYRQEKENYAFGKYTADLSLSYGTAGKVLSASTGFWVIPWHVVIVNLIGIIILVIIIYFLVKKYNAWLVKKYAKEKKAKK
ncbi:MAG: hypothetical protein A2Y82_04455 [Candidatus Buchananbacteria bacterium RBG_13_36_9]|uniref:Uncharacterized protein n=1 Tax=Candidatus Buchananbacteria bacterium RBG_13_36_9 TaxID=1797530 RepID=A0A1G1XQU0_9BACT|nr:MAG: hypothetical protein A2Y82_04455 [Candidatus Buchananbacteria bacterium RBG_13_36_9]